MTAALFAGGYRYPMGLRAALQTYNNDYCFVKDEVGARPCKLQEFGEKCSDGATCRLVGINNSSIPFAAGEWHSIKREIIKGVDRENPVIILGSGNWLSLHYQVVVGYSNSVAVVRNTDGRFRIWTWSNLREYMEQSLPGVRNFNIIEVY